MKAVIGKGKDITLSPAEWYLWGTLGSLLAPLFPCRCEFTDCSFLPPLWSEKEAGRKGSCEKGSRCPGWGSTFAAASPASGARKGEGNARAPQGFCERKGRSRWLRGRLRPVRPPAHSRLESMAEVVPALQPKSDSGQLWSCGNEPPLRWRWKSP